MIEPRTMSEPRTQTLEVPGARLRYDIRDADGEPTAPPLLMIALPMDATGFTTLAGHFRDRTVVTYDPRGIGRSERTDGAKESTAEQHADDVHRLISDLGAGPVDIFGSSGGAVTGLVLVAMHPEQVRTLVAHEPPAAYLLPDAEQVRAAFNHVQETYQREGFGPAMAKFMVLSSLTGRSRPISPSYRRRAPPTSASRPMTTARAMILCSGRTTARRATNTTSTYSARRRPAS
jgi:pimeloyl-ACP methyl ester carboxylesterase